MIALVSGLLIIVLSGFFGLRGQTEYRKKKINKRASHMGLEYPMLDAKYRVE